MSGTEIMNKTCVWYNHNTLTMKKWQIQTLLNVGPRQQVWVSWSAVAPLIANTGETVSKPRNHLSWNKIGKKSGQKLKKRNYL